MRIVLAAVAGGRTKTKSGEMERLVGKYLKMSGRYEMVEAVTYASERALLEAAGGGPGRVAAWVMLLDVRGEMLTSEEFATVLGKQRDEGARRLVVAVGPADGWSGEARARAGLVVSFGRMTMAHGLARVVLAEQVYRALTILAGHPYHCGH